MGWGVVFRQGLMYQRLALNLIHNWSDLKRTCCLHPSCWDPSPGPHLVFSAGGRSQGFTRARQGPYKLSPLLVRRRSLKTCKPGFHLPEALSATHRLPDTAKLISQAPQCEDPVLATLSPHLPQSPDGIELLISVFLPVWVSAHSSHHAAFRPPIRYHNLQHVLPDYPQTRW